MEFLSQIVKYYLKMYKIAVLKKLYQFKRVSDTIIFAFFPSWLAFFTLPGSSISTS